MTDGLTLSTTVRPTQTRMDCLCMEVDCAVCYQPNNEYLPAPDRLDLTNLSAWLELQSPATIANILDVTANELYRRQDWPSIAGRVKDAASDLRVVSR